MNCLPINNIHCDIKHPNFVHRTLCPTRGQWLPYRKHDMVKDDSLFLPFALTERSWVQTPRPPKKIEISKLVFTGRRFSIHSNFSFTSSFANFCQATQLENSFLQSPSP